MVRLTVADTGTGMSGEVKKRAFEPFFTTKKRGQGVGFGLSTVYGYVQQLGGRIELDSHEGEGTRVNLLLPAAEQQPIVPAKQGPVVSTNIPKGGHVLLVDDDATVRETVADMMVHLGYAVEQAPDAETALALTERGVVADLIVADIVLPGIHGVALAAELRRRRPEIPILLITGYPGDLPEAAAWAAEFRVLRKPFHPHELAEAIQECRAEAV